MQAMDTSVELDARLFDGHTTRTRRTHPQRLQRYHARTRSAWRLTRRGFNAARCRLAPAGLRQGERVLHLPSPPGLATPWCAGSLPLCRATVASPAAHTAGRRACRTRAEPHAHAMSRPSNPPHAVCRAWACARWRLATRRARALQRAAARGSTGRRAAWLLCRRPTPLFSTKILIPNVGTSP